MSFSEYMRKHASGVSLPSNTVIPSTYKTVINQSITSNAARKGLSPVQIRNVNVSKSRMTPPRIK